MKIIVKKNIPLCLSGRQKYRHVIPGRRSHNRGGRHKIICSLRTDRGFRPTFDFSNTHLHCRLYKTSFTRFAWHFVHLCSSPPPPTRWQGERSDRIRRRRQTRALLFIDKRLGRKRIYGIFYALVGGGGGCLSNSLGTVPCAIRLKIIHDRNCAKKLT